MWELPDEGGEESEGWSQESLHQGRQEDEGEGDPNHRVQDAGHLPCGSHRVDVSIT